MRVVKAWLPVILWAAVILSASNDAFSADQSQGWLAAVIGYQLAHAINIAVRKVGHLVAYALLGGLAWRADRRAWVAVLVALLVASTDEWKQSMTTSRTGSPWDVLLDCAGAWLGTLSLQMLFKPRRDATID